MEMIVQGRGDPCPKCDGQIVPDPIMIKSCHKCNFVPAEAETELEQMRLQALQNRPKPVVLDEDRDPGVELKDQLGFIETSCREFDAGTVREGARIAHQLREIFYQVGGQTPVMDCFDTTNVGLLSTCCLWNPYFLVDGSNLVWRRHPDNLDDAEYFAPLSQNDHTRILSLEAWWNKEIIYQFYSGGVRTSITRRMLSLAAANKDGGSHVDPKRGAAKEYARIRKDPNWIRVESTGEVNDFPLPNAHLFALRQIGYEVLNSPDIRALAGI